MKVGDSKFLYMMEQEGMLNTRESHINAAIKEFKRLRDKGYNINSNTLQDKVLSKYSLTDLKDTEKRRIAREVGR